MKVYVIFYSMYGHVYKMAQAVAEGAEEAGADVKLFQVSELVPEETLEKSGAKEAKEAFKDVPVASIDRIAEPDAVIFGTPTRYGNMCAQMRNFLDQSGNIWQKGLTVGKVGSVFASTATQHGGQETTITSFHTTLLHLGFVVVGVPYAEQRLMDVSEMSGGSPYGASTIAAPDGSRWPSENELGIARFQGKYVSEVTQALLKGRGQA